MQPTSIVVLVEGPGQDVIGSDALLDGLHVLRAGPVLVQQQINRAIVAPLEAVPSRALSNCCIFGDEVLNLK